MTFNNKKKKNNFYFILMILLISLFSNVNISKASTDWSKFNTWETKANTNKYAFGARSVAVGTKIYSFGGYTLQVSTPRFEIYDSITDKWTVQPDMPYDTRYHGAANIGDNIYVFGGQRTDVEATDEVYCYNITTGTWTQKASMLEPRRSFAQAIIDGKIYITAGFGLGSYLRTTECYDPVTDKWTRLADMPERKSSLSGVASNGKFYTFGGWNGVGGSQYLNTVHVYDPKTNEWQSREGMPKARNGIITEEYLGYIFFTGGKEETTDSTNELYCYSTYIDKWIELEPMPTPRYNYNAVRIDNKLYIINGSVGSTPYKTTELYNIPSEEYLAFAFANKYRTKSSIDVARRCVNNMINITMRAQLQGLLDKMIPVDMPTINTDKSSTNADIYISPLNKLSVTLETNSISFNEFNGTEEIERIKAFDIKVESTLPYSIEASLPTNIADNNNNVLNKDIISIKESNSLTYQTFSNSINSLKLIENTTPSGIVSHGIDIRLNPKILPETSIYKTAIEFKVQQK